MNSFDNWHFLPLFSDSLCLQWPLTTWLMTPLIPSSAPLDGSDFSMAAQTESRWFYTLSSYPPPAPCYPWIMKSSFEAVILEYFHHTMNRGVILQLNARWWASPVWQPTSPALAVSCRSMWLILLHTILQTVTSSKNNPEEQNWKTVRPSGLEILRQILPACQAPGIKQSLSR